jgi:Integrase zinc binding domain
LLKSEFIRSLDLQSKSIEFETLIRRHSKNREERVERALRNKEEGWKELESGLITFRECVYVPIHAKLREDIIRKNHDSTFAGHPGCYKTAELVTRNYWWPRVQHDVRGHVDARLARE